MSQQGLRKKIHMLHVSFPFPVWQHWVWMITTVLSGRMVALMAERVAGNASQEAAAGQAAC